MQTPVERMLVRALAESITNLQVEGRPRILAVGAGQSLAVENQLGAAGLDFIEDRCDVEDCAVDDARVDNAWTCPAEAMAPVPSAHYDAAFSHFVLEHVPDPAAAAKEIFRVLKPWGVYAATFPNPQAPEFRVSALTPTWFHELVRGKEAWPTVYAYGTVDNLVRIFEAVGFTACRVEASCFVEGYLGRFPVLGTMARAYDRRVMRGVDRSRMGHALALFQRPG